MHTSIIHKGLICGVVILTSMCLLAARSNAQVPRTISYQGVLTNDGAGLDGQHLITVALYDSLKGGTQLYQESHQLTVMNGIFDMEIGSISPFPLSLTFDQPYYLGVSIDGNPEMTPRVALDAAPYALSAGIAQLAEGLTSNASGVVTSINELAGPIRITGDSITTVTENGNDITIHAKAATASGIQSVNSPDNTLDITNSDGPNVSAGVADNAITTAKLANGAVTPQKLAQDGATKGQVLKWNGTAWAVANDSVGTGSTSVSYTAGQGISISGNTISATGGLLAGTVLNSTLRWNGSNWVENPNMTSDASGNTHINGTTNLGDGLGADNITMSPGTGQIQVNGWDQGVVVSSATGVLSPAQLTGGTGISIAQTAGNITITNTGSVGWLLNGNAGTLPPTNFLGTTDNQALVFKTNDTEAMRITNTRSVGIGTSTPVRMLDVVDNSGQNAAQFENNNSSTAINFQAAAVLMNRTSTAAPTELSFSRFNSSSILFGYASIDMIPNNLIAGSEAGSLVFGTRTNGPTNVTEKMRITNLGLVGIGTSTPTQELNVSNGNFLLSRTGTTTDSLQFQGTSTGISSFEAGAQGSTTINYTLPTSQPTANQVLAATAVSGSGPYAVTLGWVAPSIDTGGSGWNLTGNSGTTAGTNFLGTTDNEAFEIHVYDSYGTPDEGTGRVLRIAPVVVAGTPTSPNITGGYSENSISGPYPFLQGGNVIAGGGVHGAPNRISAQFSTIGGGTGQTIDAETSTIGGGNANTITGGSNGAATIAGGSENGVIGTLGTIGGGFRNLAGLLATAAGGGMDTASGDASFIGGGGYDDAISYYSPNVASGAASSILGGVGNRVSGQNSSIAGGSYLQLSGTGSFGYHNGSTSAGGATVSANSTAFFGNVNLWLGNTNNTASQLRFYGAQNGGGAFPASGTHYSGFVASSQSADINYTLPSASPVANGNLLLASSGSSSTMVWSTGLVWDNTNARLGINTTSPAYPLHSVYSATTDEIAAIYGNATGSTTNQAIGLWGDASNTNSSNTGSIGVLATGNGNTTAGQTNVALQLNDGEFTMGRTTESPSIGSDVEPATGGTAYSQQGPSGMVELTLGSSGNLTTSAPAAGTIQDVGSITINNHYVEDGSIVLLNVVAMIDDGVAPNPQNAAWVVNADSTASGSFVIRVKMIPTITNASNYSTNDKVRIGYVVVNKSK